MLSICGALVHACTRSLFYSKLNIFQKRVTYFLSYKKNLQFFTLLVSLSVCFAYGYHRLLMLLLLTIDISLAKVLSGQGSCSRSLSLLHMQQHTHSSTAPPSSASSLSSWLPWLGKRGLDGREERRQWGCDTTMAGSDLRSTQISANTPTPKHQANKHPWWRDKHATQTMPNICCKASKLLKIAASLIMCYRIFLLLSLPNNKVITTFSLNIHKHALGKYPHSL